MKKITSLFILFAFLFSPLSPVFAELTRDEQVELLRAEITRVTNQLNAILEERVYEGYALILADRGDSLQPLRIGDRGTQVTELQNLLNREGVYNGAATGYYGPLTDEAVQRFEKKYEFYLKSHALNTQDKIVSGSFYNFSFDSGVTNDLPRAVSPDAERDIEFTRDVITETYSDVDRYKQDIFISLNATDGSAKIEAELGIESVANIQEEQVYIYVEGEVDYDLGFLASGDGDIEAEMLLSRDGVFVKVEESDLFVVPTEYDQYFGEWIGLEFDDLDELMTAAEAEEFDEIIEEAFEQMFDADAQIDAYDQFPFYAIDTESERVNNSLTRSEGKDVYTYDIRFDLDNFDQLADALNESNDGFGTYQAADITSVANEFSDVLDDLEFTVDVSEDLELLGAAMNFSQIERTAFGTSQIQVTFKSVNRLGEGTVPDAPRDYIDLVDLYEETLGEAQQQASDARAVANLQQLQLALELERRDDGLYPAIDDITIMDVSFLDEDYYWVSGDISKADSLYCVEYELEDDSRGAYYVISHQGAGYSDNFCFEWGPAE